MNAPAFPTVDRDPFAEDRRRMVRTQLRERNIRDPRVLAVFARVRRERFVPDTLRESAYADCAVPLGEGQTISQPYIVARMTELLAVEPGQRVLEIGTGSGYQTAILHELGAEVFSIERVETLARRADLTLRALGIDVPIHIADGSLGLPREAPFHRILAACAGPEIPKPWLDQLSGLGGRLVLPVGPRGHQDLLLVRREGERVTQSRDMGCTFVPLVGCHGYDRPW